MSQEPFLSRWSRLKRASAQPPSTPADVVEAPPPPALPAENGGEGEVRAEREPVELDLPPIEELTAESDFTPFLRAEVPENLHREALRKLWTSDPVFANDDGLKDYAEDYASLFTGNAPVRTLYRIGKGFLDAAEELGAEELGAEELGAERDGAVAAAEPAAEPAVEAPPAHEPGVVTVSSEPPSSVPTGVIKPA